MTPDESTQSWLTTDFSGPRVSIDSYDLSHEGVYDFDLYVSFEGYFSFSTGPYAVNYETLQSTSISVTIEMINPCREISSSNI